MKRLLIVVAILILGAAAFALKGSESKPSKATSSAGSAVSSSDTNQEWMIEGEKRYRTNCGRCHQPPHKFQPRVMATAVRHMRVRAMLTDEDMKYVLFYLTH
jgi:hypothetical protein